MALLLPYRLPPLRSLTAFQACLFAFLALASCQRPVSPAVASSAPPIPPKVATANKPISDSLSWPVHFGFGRAATPEEIAALDIDVRPDGTGLPSGSGSVVKGKALYALKCASCHGKTGVEGPLSVLVGPVSQSSQTATGSAEPAVKTIGNYWPYATTLYDYINRAMPFSAPGSLSPDEVYSLTAFLLHANEVIDANTILNARTLPKVEMPARFRFIPDDRRGGPEVR